MTRFCQPSRCRNVFESKMASFQSLLTLIMDDKLSDREEGEGEEGAGGKEGV